MHYPRPFTQKNVMPPARRCDVGELGGTGTILTRRALQGGGDFSIFKTGLAGVLYQGDATGERRTRYFVGEVHIEGPQELSERRQRFLTYSSHAKSGIGSVERANIASPSAFFISYSRLNLLLKRWSHESAVATGQRRAADSTCDSRHFTK